MPFRSKSQLRACWAKNDPNWDCHEWAKKTKSTKKLPEAVKKASDKIAQSFSKIAKELFDPTKVPIVPAQIATAEVIRQAKNDKMKGMTPSEYRRNMTKSKSGIVAQNRKTSKADQV